MGKSARFTRSTVARDTVLSLVAISLVGGSATVYSVLVGRLLGERALGQAGLALGVGLGLAQLATAGLAPALTRFTAAYRAAGRSGAVRRALGQGLGMTLGLGLGLAALGLATSAVWAPRLGLPRSLWLPVAALVALQAAYIGLKAALYGLARVGVYTWAEIAAGGAFLAALGLLLAGAPVSLPGPFLAANVVFCVIAGPAVIQSARALRGPSQATSRSRWCHQTTSDRTMLRFAAIATVGSAAALARQPLAVVLTGLLWPTGEVGRLQAALTLLPVVLLAPRALELALFPALAQAYGRTDMATLRRQTAGALRVCFVSLGLVAGNLLLLGPTLLRALYGPAFAASVSALDAVVVSGWALGLAVPAVAALSGADAVAIPNLAGVAGLAVSVVAWVALVPSGGATGAALGLALGSGIIAMICLIAARQRYGLVLAPLGAGAAWMALLLGPSLLIARRGLLPPGLVALGFSVGIAVVAGLGLRRRARDPQELAT